MRHTAAFALMWYACFCGHRERIWNSREGITPFSLGCPTCGSPFMRHVDWQHDRPEPHYVPNIGQRVWVNLTRERAKEYATLLIAQMLHAGQEMEVGVTEQQWIEHYAERSYGAFGEGTTPDLVIVGMQSVPQTRWSGNA